MDSTAKGQPTCAGAYKKLYRAPPLIHVPTNGGLLQAGLDAGDAILHGGLWCRTVDPQAD
jgi:hypothetical protein